MMLNPSPKQSSASPPSACRHLPLASTSRTVFRLTVPRTFSTRVRAGPRRPSKPSQRLVAFSKFPGPIDAPSAAPCVPPSRSCQIAASATPPPPPPPAAQPLPPIGDMPSPAVSPIRPSDKHHLNLPHGDAQSHVLPNTAPSAPTLGPLLPIIGIKFPVPSGIAAPEESAEGFDQPLDFPDIPLRIPLSPIRLRTAEDVAALPSSLQKVAREALQIQEVDDEGSHSPPVPPPAHALKRRAQLSHRLNEQLQAIHMHRVSTLRSALQHYRKTLRDDKTTTQPSCTKPPVPCETALGWEAVPLYTAPALHRMTRRLLRSFSITANVPDDTGVMQRCDLHVFQLLEEPTILELANLLTDKEAETLIDLGNTLGWTPCKTSKGHIQATPEHYSAGFSPNRTSDQALVSETCAHPGKALLRRVEHRLATCLKIPLDRIEPPALVRYQPGQQFKAHHDGAFRSHSLIIYLNDVEEGGDTEFPTLQLAFAPKKGSALCWENCCADGTADSRTLHAGAPVIRGVKYCIPVFVHTNPPSSYPRK